MAKISGVEAAEVVMLQVQASWICGSGMVLNSTGCNKFSLPRQVIYEMILADHEHFEQLVWPYMIARWHH